MPKQKYSKIKQEKSKCPLLELQSTDSNGTEHWTMSLIEPELKVNIELRDIHLVMYANFGIFKDLRKHSIYIHTAGVSRNPEEFLRQLASGINKIADMFKNNQHAHTSKASK